MSHWLLWARELQALGQTGLTFAQHPAEKQRYARIQEISASMLSQLSGQSTQSVLQKINIDRGYATPKMGVRAVVFRGDSLLLVQEKYGGQWNIPGGWVEVGDSLKEAVEREVWEEAGLNVKAGVLVAIWDCDRHNPEPYHFHGFHLCFLCQTDETSQPKPSDETIDCGFFLKSEIEGLALNPLLKEQLSFLFTLLDGQNIQTRVELY